MNNYFTSLMMDKILAPFFWKKDEDYLA
jgi:hypothetical protein